MGLDDRDYVRGDDREYFAGAPRSMTATIIIVTGTIFLLDVLFDGVIQKYARLDSDLFAGDWKLWTLVTYGFVHSITSMGHVFWNMFALYMFGSRVEEKYGPAEYLRIYLVTLAAAGAVWLVANRLEGFAGLRQGDVLIGASGAVTAIAILFALNYPRATILLMFVIPVPAWVLPILYVGGDLMLLGNVARGGDADRVAFEAHLAGAAFAFAYFFLNWNFNRLSSFDPRRWLRSRPKLRVHRGPTEDDRLDEKVDRILEKISREGKDSLTARERKTLQEASKRANQRRG